MVMKPTQFPRNNNINKGQRIVPTDKWQINVTYEPDIHKLKSANCRPPNCSTTPHFGRRQNTHACASNCEICACELYRWHLRESSSSTRGPKVSKAEKPDRMKSKPWDFQVAVCLSCLPYSTWWPQTLICRIRIYSQKVHLFNALTEWLKLLYLHYCQLVWFCYVLPCVFVS